MCIYCILCVGDGCKTHDKMLGKLQISSHVGFFCFSLLEYTFVLLEILCTNTFFFNFYLSFLDSTLIFVEDSSCRFDYSRTPTTPKFSTNSFDPEPFNKLNLWSFKYEEQFSTNFNFQFHTKACRYKKSFLPFFKLKKNNGGFFQVLSKTSFSSRF